MQWFLAAASSYNPWLVRITIITCFLDDQLTNECGCGSGPLRISVTPRCQSSQAFTVLQVAGRRPRPAHATGRPSISASVAIESFLFRAESQLQRSIPLYYRFTRSRASYPAASEAGAQPGSCWSTRRRSTGVWCLVVCSYVCSHGCPSTCEDAESPPPSTPHTTKPRTNYGHKMSNDYTMFIYVIVYIKL